MKKYHAFTLIELMITLAIASVLLCIAIPSWKELQQQQQTKTVLQQLINTLAFARTTAIISHQKVLISPKNNDWREGWAVIKNQQIIRLFPALPNKTPLIWHGSRQLNQITFNANGSAEGSFGHFIYDKYSLFINMGGRVRLETKK